MTGRSGLTLVELVVSLAIVAVLLGVGGTYLLASLPTLRANGAVRQLVADFRLARELSVKRNLDVLIRFRSPTATSYTMAFDTYPAGHPDGQLTADDEPVKVVDLAALYEGIEFTPYTTGLSPSNDPLPADGVSFPGDLAVFQPSGSARAGSVYVRPSRDAGRTRRTERGVTVIAATGRARAYRWEGSWK